MTTSKMTAELLETFRVYAKRQEFDFEPASLYAPIRYAMSSGGKSVRPLLLLLCHALKADQPDQALPAAYAVELFHNFTLLHDDIMDQADLRRGRDTVHKVYGEAAAILSGDAMLIRTYGYLLDNYDETTAVKLLKPFQKMAAELCAGQQLDMDMEAGFEASYEDYLTMIHGKTGVLITTSMVMGGLIAGLTSEQLALLERAGDLAGRAFQIQDDLLDSFRTSEQTGKSDYGDIVRGKQNAPYVLAMNTLSEEDRIKLKMLYKLSPEERKNFVREVLSLLRAYNIEEKLAEEVRQLSQEAITSLESIHGNETATRQLIQFVELLALRES